MKKVLSFLIIIAAIWLGGNYYFKHGGGVQEVKFVRLENFRFNQVSAFPKFSFTTSATAVMNNPNPFGAQVTGMDFDVYVDDKHTTNVHQIVKAPMPAKQIFKMPIQFEIPLGKMGFFKDAKSILTGAWKNQSLKIKTVGVISIKILKVEVELPFEEESEYKLKDYLKE